MGNRLVNLSTVLLPLGDYKGARKHLFKRAPAIFETAYGRKHPKTVCPPRPA